MWHNGFHITYFTFRIRNFKGFSVSIKLCFIEGLQKPILSNIFISYNFVTYSILCWFTVICRICRKKCSSSFPTSSLALLMLWKNLPPLHSSSFFLHFIFKNLFLFTKRFWHDMYILCIKLTLCMESFIF